MNRTTWDSGRVIEKTSLSRPVTMEDVARRAQVSRALVSLVMRDSPHVSADKRSAVREAALALGYSPNRLASRLASRRTSTLGVLLLDLHNPVFADIYDGILEGVEHSGNHLMVAVGSTDLAREAEAVRSLLDMRVDGILLAGYTGSPESLALMLGGTPAVVITREVEVPGIDSASASDHRGAQLAVEHLQHLGHKEIVHIAKPPGLPYPGRRLGYIQAMESQQLAPVIITADMTERGGRQAIDRYLDSGAAVPTAIFADNDLVALGVLDALSNRNISVPDDVSVVGYDNTELAESQLVSLTSVDHHARELGRLAASAILRRLSGDTQSPPINTHVDPLLVVRQTTAAPRH
ncbi:LacI family DNA-binding transcriptional regulator [Pseudarthrobacter sp. DSP2-3-2b1]|uniref:LacI family DNA-binding transcriptional regulator n=1 Tax=Pseudarthrobacter sp. DSP2-3-2b1 TaxID=2804661 RepID=UPI003CEB081F